MWLLFCMLGLCLVFLCVPLPIYPPPGPTRLRRWPKAVRAPRAPPTGPLASGLGPHDNIPYPIWKYTHKGFPPTSCPPSPRLRLRRPRREVRGHGGGISDWYIFILHEGYCIYIYIYVYTHMYNSVRQISPRSH